MSQQPARRARPIEGDVSFVYPGDLTGIESAVRERYRKGWRLVRVFESSALTPCMLLFWERGAPRMAPRIPGVTRKVHRG